MKFDPRATPFWEQRQGGGPITATMKRHELAANARRREEEALQADLARLKARRAEIARNPRNEAGAQAKINEAKRLSVQIEEVEGALMVRA